MKRRYYGLLAAFTAEYLIIKLADHYNIIIRSLFGNTVGAVLFFMPMLILLFSASRDEDFSEKERRWSQIGFWYMTYCFSLGVIVEFLIWIGS